MVLAQVLNASVRTTAELMKAGLRDSETCSCGMVERTLDHRWFACPKWSTARRPWLQQMPHMEELPPELRSYGLRSEDPAVSQWQQELWTLPSEGF